MPFALTTFLGIVLSLSASSADLSLCRGDAERFCKGMKLTDVHVTDCLKSNLSKMTPGCKMALADNKDLSVGVSEACGIDVKTHCGGVKQEDGSIKKCLHDHHRSLSHNCQATIQPNNDPLKGASPMDKAGSLFNPQ